MNLKPYRLLLIALWLIFAATIAPAQNYEGAPNNVFDFYARAPFRPEVPRPNSILRYDVGDFHTNYSQMERVITAIAAAAPDRVRMYDIGRTNEYREQHLVVISSPENINRLEQIKANVARLADPRRTSPAEANQVIANTPAIVWLSYTIHGNESASFETMMQVVYQLAASTEPATEEMLRNTVAVINVCSNPDGHERFVTWYNSVATGNADRAALEHREPWSVFGRYNRFRFDLNRDNVASTQVETRNMQRAYFEWNPQIYVDHHGQPSQYFFPPAALPINPNLPQPQTNKWLDVFGRANAAQFDQRGWDYYVRDIFDLFYPGYWDSFPSLNGATGMTYETDGGGFKGLRWTREDGTIATFRSAIAKHFVASLTTLETAARNRESRLRDYYEFKRTAVETGRTDALRYIIIDANRDRNKARELVQVLNRAGIEVSIAGDAFQATRTRAYSDRNAAAQTRAFSAGSYIIDLAQPQKRLAKALLEPDTPQDAAFVREQLARFRRNETRGRSQQKEEYQFYDITAWNLPLAFGLDAYYTTDAPQSSRLTAVTAESLQQMAVAGTAAPRRARVAYIVPYKIDAAAVLAMRLLKQDFRVGVATKPLNAVSNGVNVDYPAGTFVVRVTRNPETIHEAVGKFSVELGVTVNSIDTGFQESGDTGIGAETIAALRQPKIAMIADEPVDQTSYGSIWWTLDRYGIEFTPLTINNVRGGALENYNVLIMPEGSTGRYNSALGASGVETLKDWIGRGNTLIAVKGAAVFAALKDVGLTSSRLVGSADDDQQLQTTESPKNTREEKETELSSADNQNQSNQNQASPSQRIRSNKQNANSNSNQNNNASEGNQTTDNSNVNPQGLPFDKADGAPPALPPIVSPSANRGRVPEAVPGAIMRASVDQGSYLTYGIEGNTLPVLLSSAYFFRPSREGTNAVVFEPNPRRPLTVSGFVWEGNTERLLSGTSYIIDEPTGRGHVILFAEEPFYRGIYRNTTRLFFNSLLLGGAF